MSGESTNLGPGLQVPVRRHRLMGAVWAFILAAAAIFLYTETFAYFWRAWRAEAQYSIAYLVPIVSGYFLWKQWPEVARTKRAPSVLGLVLIVLALVLHLGGTILDVSGPSGISTLVYLLGVCTYVHGVGLVRTLWFPLAYLLFAIPVPGGVTDIIGFPLQLWASGTTAVILRTIGLEVARAGVHLSVPGFEFQVAEACSGMSSLVAMIGVTAVFAYLTGLPPRYKWLLFFMAVPVALAANVTRITAIALVGYQWGSEAATGLYHDWSSPILFVAGIMLLFAISWVLEKISGATGRPQRSASNPAGSGSAARTGDEPSRGGRRAPAGRFLIVTLLTLVAAGAGNWVAARSPVVSFSARLEGLPAKIGAWRGEDLEITEDIQRALSADKILSRRYVESETGQQLGLLIVYRKYGRREFAHRPELCYPAAGWEIVQKTYTTVPWNDGQVRSRLVIAEKGLMREVIAYWFASGDRTEANFAKQQIRMALDRLQDQRYGWAFIRINVPVSYDDDEALDAVRSFLRTADKPLIKVLTGHQ